MGKAEIHDIYMKTRIYSQYSRNLLNLVIISPDLNVTEKEIIIIQLDFLYTILVSCHYLESFSGRNVIFIFVVPFCSLQDIPGITSMCLLSHFQAFFLSCLIYSYTLLLNCLLSVVDAISLFSLRHLKPVLSSSTGFF